MMAALAAVLVGGRSTSHRRLVSGAVVRPVPTEIVLARDERSLQISFASGETFRLPAELLRVYTPSAEGVMHGGTRKVVGGRRNVRIRGVEPVGNYAVQLIFDDLHSTGIYSWAHLHDLGVHKFRYAREYIALLRARGLSREPPERGRA